jgi:pimeloyl-ACP methyl ester carboxylesterase
MRLAARVSFRELWKGGGVRATPDVWPQSPLGTSRHLLLLIHGFNNDANAALRSYDRFLAEQFRLGLLTQRVVRVYWPGDVGVSFYYRSIRRAQDTALHLARWLDAAARRRDGLVLDVVAHSMGCRLTLELIREIAAIADSPVIVRRVVFMAAAVPVQHLFLRNPVEARSLRPAFDDSGARGLSLFSPDDVVLRFTFPLGQRMGDSLGYDFSGRPIVALGYRRWNADTAMRPRLRQRQAKYANHWHYWPNTHGYVAPAVRNFVGSIGVAHDVIRREMTERRTLWRTIANGMSRSLRARRVGES